MIKETKSSDCNYDNCLIYWNRIVPEAILPKKAAKGAGFDVYAADRVTPIRIEPHAKVLIGTGIRYIIPNNDYYLQAFDRGSTGSVGLHVHCGVCDADYRGEVFICLCNDNPYPVLISSNRGTGYFDDDFLPLQSSRDPRISFFNYNPSKAIAQLVPIKMPTVEVAEVNAAKWDELNKITNSERGTGKLGSSGN